MKQFPRTDTLLIRCSPELKVALKKMQGKFWSASDVIHEAIARSYRVHYQYHLPSLEEHNEFCNKLYETNGKKELREKERNHQKYLKEKLKQNPLIK